MADYLVSTSGDINFFPGTEVEEILQNVRMILTTRVGTVPLDRDFGLSWGAVDAPAAVSQMRARAEIIEAGKAFEPRATVKKVEFNGDFADGRIEPVVTISIGDSNG